MVSSITVVYAIYSETHLCCSFLCCTMYTFTSALSYVKIMFRTVS